jgi:hypothetical protein
MSCEEKISIELNDMENERIVVEGRITNELKRHSIRLTRTASYFQNERVPPVLEAEVYLREEGSGTRFDLELVNDTFGIYETPEFEGRIGETYTIHINYSGESYQASSYLDSVAEIDSLSYEYEFVSYADQGFYKIRMSAYEPPPVGDVYMFNMYINDTLFNNALDNTPYSDDLLFDDTYMVNVEITWLPQEEIISDTNHILIEMFSTSQEEYKFINAFITETYYSGSIFNGPPANIPSNLICTTGGIDGLGFFAASAVTRQEMILYKQHDDSTNNPDYER